MMKLTLRPEMHIGKGAQLGGRVFQYLVVGVPSGESISIGENPDTKRWRIYRNHTGWVGDYAAPEEALSALESELNPG